MENSKTFFLADSHFHHEKVIEYDNRPYTSVFQMDKDMIKKWNSVVKKNDIVWFLGDLAMTENKEYLKNLISKLNGRKRMVMGNHDKCRHTFYLEAGFEEVYKHPVIIKGFFVLSHEPLQGMSDNSPFFFIYGHVHNDEIYATKTEHTMCVSACRHNYTPVEIEEYYEYIRQEKADKNNREL